RAVPPRAQQDVALAAGEVQGEAGATVNRLPDRRGDACVALPGTPMALTGATAPARATGADLRSALSGAPTGRRKPPPPRTAPPPSCRPRRSRGGRSS